MLRPGDTVTFDGKRFTVLYEIFSGVLMCCETDNAAAKPRALIERYLKPAPASPYELLARARKAEAFAIQLHAFEIAAADVQRISAEAWRDLATALDINPPSAETIQMIESLLRRMEEADAKMARALGGAR